MALLDQLQKDLVAAMKAKEEAEAQHRPHDQNRASEGAGGDPSKPLTEAAEQQLLKSLVKQRIDAAEMFRKGGREELAVKEEAERRSSRAICRPRRREEEIDAAVAAAIAETGATSAKQMGLVIKAAQAKLAGKTVDGKSLSEKVKSKLS